MKLEIYNKKEIVKTYESDPYSLEMGIVEDILKIVNIDDLQSLDKKSISFLIVKTVPKSMNIFKYLLKEIFDGLTDDEFRHTKVKNIIDVILEIIVHSMEELGLSDDDEKN
ncbi:MAG: hypothetical protein II013_02895 [Lachnobacterium sp.]|nr:hypothetical protein [Lachnobacterium sp.]